MALQRQWLLAASLCSAVVGCGNDESGEPGPSVPEVCGSGTVPLADGSCLAVGIPSDGCAAGFEHVDGACVAILPAACGPGTMALPGEASCREVAPCDGSRWGAAPVDGATQYVDQSHSGASDGSEGAPWTTITEAVTSAAPGGLVAVAQGSYAETVAITGKAVRLWGSCPGEVEIVGPPTAVTVVDLGSGASGTEVHDLAIRGGGVGVRASGATGLLLERVYIHDTGERGLDVEGFLGPTAAVLRDSLVEGTRQFGVFALGADVAVERTVVRDTQPDGTGNLGRGIESSYDPGEEGHTVTVSGSVVERNHEAGIMVAGHGATIDATVIRDTLPRGDGTGGRGVICQLSFGTEVRCTMQLSRSVIAANHEFGLHLSSSDAVVERTTIRDTIEGVLQTGRGLEANEMPGSPGQRSTLTLRDSLVAGNTQHGVNVVASDALIERTLVRDSLPQQATQFYGEGIMIQASMYTEAPSVATVQSCAVERSHAFGVLVVGSSVALADTAVRDTAGQAFDGLYGDGIAMVSYLAPASGTVLGSFVAGSQRAGIANFAAALSLGDSVLDCNRIDLASEPYQGGQPQLEDLGNNHCGCGSDSVTCHAVSSGLQPPGPPPR